MRFIDADALIEAMEDRKKIWLSKCEYNDAIREVKEAPTVERPHGKWIETDNRWGVGAWECSACTMYTIQRFAFCPHCGASMKVEGEVDDRE